MKEEPKKVYILTNHGYDEIKYSQLISMRNTDKSYSKRHYFIPIQGFLVEVSEQDYHEMYKQMERERYLEKLKSKYLLSITDFENDFSNGEEYIADPTSDFVEAVNDKMMLDKLAECLLQLSDEERFIVESVFYNGLSERDLELILGVSHPVINKRKRKILQKLKTWLEN